MDERVFRDLLARDDTYVRVGGRYRRLRAGDDGLVIYIKVGERRYVQMVADDGPPPVGARVCPGCGFDNQAASRFCAECGRSLAGVRAFVRQDGGADVLNVDLEAPPEPGDVVDGGDIEVPSPPPPPARIPAPTAAPPPPPASGPVPAPPSPAPPRVCRGCGFENQATSDFCAECGSALAEVVPELAPPPPPRRPVSPPAAPPPRPSVRPPAATPRPPTPRSVPPPTAPPTPPRRVPPPAAPVRPSPDRDEPRREPVQVELVTTWPTPDDQGLTAKVVRAVNVVDREAGTAFTGCLWYIAICIGLALVVAVLAAIFGGGR